ncbi:MAG: hypothetical protein N2442_14610 [Spirochaetes bacterium]|nr:hypothetical protein [Spirochaetota bacterium]
MDRVVLRIQPLTQEWEILQIVGVDPFSDIRITLLYTLFPLTPLDLSFYRHHFDTWPRTEIHLFRSYADSKDYRPECILYFVGVPDTTPEFLSADRLLQHLEKSLR